MATDSGSADKINEAAPVPEQAQIPKEAAPAERISAEQANKPLSVKSEATDDVKLTEAQEPDAAVKDEQVHEEPAKEEPNGNSEGPSDSDIVEKLKELLSADDMDFQTVTERQLRKQLEEHFGVSLNDRKAVVKAEVLAWIEHLPREEEDNLEDQEAEEEEDKPVKQRGGGLTATCQLSEPLKAFLGEETCSRPQVVKRVWAYIRENNLQNPSNKQKINLDEKLATLFTPPIDMFSMNKQLSKHIFSPEPGAGPSKERAPRKRKSEGGKAQPKPRKKAKAEDGVSRPSNFSKPVTVSDELAEVLGGQKEISRPQITKKLWEYFKANNLQNPENKREIIADEKLEKLTGEKRFVAFGISKLIKSHIFPSGGSKAETKASKKEVKEEEEVEVEVSDMDE